VYLKNVDPEVADQAWGLVPGRPGYSVYHQPWQWRLREASPGRSAGRTRAPGHGQAVGVLAVEEHSESLESSSDWYADPMTGGDRPGAEQPPVKWLTVAELDSWLAVVRLISWLPWSIDQQLRRDSDLGTVEYQVLAVLAEAPERTMRMSSLAVLTNASLSRLSHLFKRLEGRGLVRREPDPADGRFTNAILTEKGFQTLAEAAPGHVAHVRSLVIDVLSSEQLRRLGIAADRIMSRIDTSGIN
jgi:DNA-binding MarR family transcriptional regulator